MILYSYFAHIPMTHTITTTLSEEIYKYICEMARIHKTSKKQVIEEAIKLLRKQKMAREIQEGLQERMQEYKEIGEEFHTAQASSLQTE
jgi:predicted transcriptional regulator